MHRLSLVALAALALCACGAPPPPTGCGPSNCGGCCAGDVCQSGTANGACGLGGRACGTCTSPQVCLNTGACGLDATAMWKVQPISAQIAATNNGTDWDADASPPDVFVNIGCPGSPDTSGATPSVESYTPTWSTGGCFATAQDLLNRGFAVQLWDEDVLSDDTITADLTVTGLQQSHFTAGYADLQPSGGMITLRVALQLQ
jgi:hypothetical protein